MGLFSRLGDIINSNLNAMLDGAENPEKIARLIIQEMEDTLVEVRTSSARTIADQKEMRRHIAKLESLQDSWKEKAELALSKDREDLAFALRLGVDWIALSFVQRPEDIAEAVYWFASDASNKSTGNILNVDAGHLASFTR